MSAAQRGATALVPPITNDEPSTTTLYPVLGSASALTSGTPRPVCLKDDVALDCHDGVGKVVEKPPPLSVHTVSVGLLLEPVRLVPPQPMALGLEAGKSTCSDPSVTPSLAPPSPEATHTGSPIATASANASSMACIACAVQLDSGPPQLIEITVGLCVVSCTAVVIASRKPWSVFGAKYTAIVAALASAPATSISSITSPSGPLASPVGEFWPPSTPIGTTVGSGSDSPLKNVWRSEAW